MIHSMSGGIIKDAGSYTFAKVRFDGEDAPRWYISEFFVAEGDRVLAPRGAANTPTPCTVIKAEHGVSGQVTPIPLRSAKKLIRKMDE